MKKLLKEIEIKNLMVDSTTIVDDFVAKNTIDGWVVEYSIDDVLGNTIKVKNTGQVRVFKTLDSVANWVKKMGILSFTVDLGNRE